ncbi:MAG: RNA-guided endonuclease TnpB family protein [Boseongicola sp.]|nr:RNA-guided endonuclease TnpB family protein [Boseongicola sp.]
MASARADDRGPAPALQRRPEERIDCHPKTGKSLTFFDQCKALTKCRRDVPGMAECPVAVQRGTLKRLDEAYKHFFRRVRNGETPGFPRFKGRARFDGISVVFGVKVRDGRLHVPGFGNMAVRRKGGNPYPGAKPVSVVLKRVGGKWHAVVCLSVEVGEPAGNGRAVGLDRNGGQVADSDGELCVMPDMARLEARSRRLQRKLSRRRKARRRRERTKRHLARVRRRIASRRRNWHHDVSRKLAAKAGTVAVEGLNVKGMTRSAKGTVEKPGKRVAQKHPAPTAASWTRAGRR